MNSPRTPSTSHITNFPNFESPQPKQNAGTTIPPTQFKGSTDSIPGSPTKQESCKADHPLKILNAAESFYTPPEAIQRFKPQRRGMNAPKKTKRSARTYRDKSIEAELEEDEMIVFRGKLSKRTRLRLLSKKTSDQSGLSQEDQHHEIQPVSSTTPHESITPNQHKAQIFPNLDSSCISRYNRSSCASCGDPDSQLNDTDGVTSYMKMIPASSPADSSPIRVFSIRAETYQQPESSFMTPADRVQNLANNLARDRIIKSRGSANFNPRSSLRKWYDPSRPKKRISFYASDSVCSTPRGRYSRELLDEDCKKKKAKMAEPKLNPNKRRPVAEPELNPPKRKALSERLPKLELPPEMKTDPAYTPIAGDIAADSYWVNVLKDMRLLPQLQLDVQEALDRLPTSSTCVSLIKLPP